MQSMEVETSPALSVNAQPREDKDGYLTIKVVHYIRRMIEEGAIRPGEKLASERTLAATLEMSRTSLRIGIASLAAMGIVKVRHGLGTFLTDSESEIQMFALSTLGALPSPGSLQLADSWQWSEAHRQLEDALACLAAKRGRKEHLKSLAVELEGLLAALDSGSDYLDHEMRFHQTMALASGNPFLAALLRSVAIRSQDHRLRRTATCRELKQRAQRYRVLYGAICSRDAAKASALLHSSPAPGALAKWAGQVQSSSSLGEQPM